MKPIVKKLIIIVLILAVAAFLEVNDKIKPLIRKDIKNPIYTIGDATYAKALKANRGVVKFGPLFGGLYPGGKAFKTADEARQFLVHQQMQPEFGVYQLSGDYRFDVKAGYINKSLAVIKKAE